MGLLGHKYLCKYVMLFLCTPVATGCIRTCKEDLIRMNIVKKVLYVFVQSMCNFDNLLHFQRDLIAYTWLHDMVVHVMSL